ncbi:MAG: hypothetical protein DMG36_11490 [Acidobacteria bacterium]|nr:MAG: hypothetical protein DMG36_11490 [Acidobacteriota bacterium]
MLFSTAIASPEDWLVGGGEMGKGTRAMDWAKTPLGPIESWPQSLRATVSLCLASNFPYLAGVGPQARADLQRWLLADLWWQASAFHGSGLH